MAKFPYTKSELMRIGQNVATLWGGSCISYEINHKERKVYFDCIEHGERFSAFVEFDDLASYK